MDDCVAPLLNGLRITFSQIRGFVTVASTNSFRQAAEALNLSQPALTQRIQQLEEGLELRLFDRNTRTVELTEAGRELLPVFLRIVNDLEGAVINARDRAARAGSMIRVACLPSCAASFLPEIIRRFRADRPEAAFVVEDAMDAQIRARIRSGDVDFGICVRHDEDAELESEDLFQDDLLVVFRPNHPLGDMERITVGALARYPLILTNRNSSVRAAIDRVFAANGLSVIPACEVTYTLTAAALAGAGLGVAILPSTSPEVHSVHLVARPVDDPGFARHIVLVRRRGVPMRRVAAAFVESLRAHGGAARLNVPVMSE